MAPRGFFQLLNPGTMPCGRASPYGARLVHSAPRPLKDAVPSIVSSGNLNRRYWNLGNIIGQGGFGLIYLGLILPMYVLLKLVELGPCDVTFIFGSISLVYFVISTMYTLWCIQKYSC